MNSFSFQSFLASFYLNVNHLRSLISIWLITTFILRLLLTSDIRAVLLAKREIDIDSFEQLINNKNVIPLIVEDSTIHRSILKVRIDFLELNSYSVY